MTTYKKLKGTISLWSNSPSAPTGYGQQALYFMNKARESGIDLAILSNYGLEGSIAEIPHELGAVPHFPRGMQSYSQDVIAQDHSAWVSKNPNQKSLLLTLYDVWVLEQQRLADIPAIASWTPLDHLTMPPKVREWLVQPNVHPIAMSPFGLKQMEENGIEGTYIPHAIDTKIMKPSTQVENGMDVTEYLGTKGKFVVGMVAANKASGLVHRKAYSENLMAFSIFQKSHPDAVLYLHTDPLFPAGWNLIALIEALGIPKESVIFPNPLEFRYGYSHKHLAACYSAMDVLLAPSYGEGFGVPTIEAQAAGTRVIASNWAASKDLVSEDGWLVSGQPQWDAGQNAWWQVPSVPDIVKALELAYQADRGVSQASIDFAKKFDVDLVWDKYWTPFLKKLLK